MILTHDWGFHKWGYPLFKSSILDWDFPWNRPSIYIMAYCYWLWWWYSSSWLRMVTPTDPHFGRVAPWRHGFGRRTHPRDHKRCPARWTWAIPGSNSWVDTMGCISETQKKSMGYLHDTMEKEWHNLIFNV